jgi:hypothetical protein
MILLKNQLDSIGLFNDIAILLFILNQNENGKTIARNNSASVFKNPLENITWISLMIQLLVLLIKMKIK